MNRKEFIDGMAEKFKISKKQNASKAKACFRSFS